MSRHIHTTEDGGHLAYGFDRSPVPGYFAEKYDVNGEIETGIETREFCIMREEIEHGSRGDVVELLEKHGVPTKHRHKIAGDLPV